MNTDITKKLDEFKQLANAASEDITVPAALNSAEIDNLSKVIHTEKDAQNFMNELKTVIANQ